MTKHDPFIVVGTGRCCSSFVSSVLHNRLGVCMGYDFKKPNSINPEGYYEDREFLLSNHNLIAGDWTLQGWLKVVHKIIDARQELGIPWGFKDPRIAELLGEYLGFFDNPHIIWCDREARLVIKSLVTKYEYSPDIAKKMYVVRMIKMDRLLKGRNILRIKIGEDRLSEEDVIAMIDEKYGDYLGC